ncbi:MAG: DUF1992 domain-containing protein [Acidimicrobiia bacterium]
MTERKPPGVDWETWVERKIREAMEAGDFDNLPGAGKPIPGLNLPHDELWWIRDKLRREQISDLPPALALRRELAEARDRIADAGTEAEVRRRVAAINERIVYVNSHTISGPPSDMVPLDVERVVDEWRRRDAEPGGQAPPT